MMSMQTPGTVLARAGMLALLVFLCSESAMAADKSSLEDFYDNKVFRVVVAYSPGGSWDTVARVFARHFGKHMPGMPRVIVVNISGAGGMVAWSATRCSRAGRRTAPGSFMDTMNDPAFVADANKIGMPLNPKPGDDVGAWVKDFLSLPPEKLKTLEGWFVQ